MHQQERQVACACSRKRVSSGAGAAVPLVQQDTFPTHGLPIHHSHPQHSIVGGTRSAGSDATSTCLPRVGEAVSCPPGLHTPGPGASGQGQGGKSAGLDGHKDVGSLLADTWS